MLQFHSHHFSVPIFQVKGDRSAEWLGLELRDPERQAVQLGHLHLPSGTCNTLEGPVDWWSNLALVGEDWFLVENFADPTLPVRTGIKVLDSGGAVCWEHGRLKLAFEGSDGPCLTDDQGQVFQLRTDTWELEDMDADVARMIHEKTQLEDESRYAFPASLNPGGVPWTTWLAQKPSPLSGVQWLDHGGWQMGAWHTGAAPNWELWLGLVSPQGENQLLMLEEGLPALHPEPYFVFGDRIVFSKGRNALGWSSPLVVEE